MKVKNVQEAICYFEDTYQELFNDYDDMKQWANTPSSVRKMIEEYERMNKEMAEMTTQMEACLANPHITDEQRQSIESIKSDVVLLQKGISEALKNLSVVKLRFDTSLLKQETQGVRDQHANSVDTGDPNAVTSHTKLDGSFRVN